MLCFSHSPLLNNCLLRNAPGWRIEKESDEKEEWALFSGFENVAHHMAYAETNDFGKYKEIAGFVEGFEVRHLQCIEGL